MGSLVGRTVGITGRRRWVEQAALLTGRGARVVHGPTVGDDAFDPEATMAATEVMLSAPVDVVVLTTTTGVDGWFAAAHAHGVDDVLRDRCANAVVLARGPKTAAAARRIGLAPSWITDGETGASLVDLLVARGGRGLRVAVQRDGGRPWLAEALDAAGARVVDVPVYRWTVPDDRLPGQRLLATVCAGAVDALTFTSSAAVHHAFVMAPDAEDLRRALGGAALAVAIGPVTAGALREHGVGRVIEPQVARLAVMVEALEAALQGAGRHGGPLALSRRGGLPC